MCSFVPIDVTYVPPATVTMTPSGTTETVADVGEGTLGLNVTIGISVVIVVLIIIGVVAGITVRVALVIIKKRANRCEAKTASNATQPTVGNGVGKLNNNSIIGRNNI